MTLDEFITLLQKYKDEFKYLSIANKQLLGPVTNEIVFVDLTKSTEYDFMDISCEQYDDHISIKILIDNKKEPVIFTSEDF